MSAMKKDVIKEANVEAVKPEVICCEPVVIKVSTNFGEYRLSFNCREFYSSILVFVYCNKKISKISFILLT